MKLEQVKVNSKFSRHSFGEVTQVKKDGLMVKNHHGYEWFVTNDVIENEFEFSDIVEAVEVVTPTRLTEILMENRSTIMTVNFNKKIDEKLLEAKLFELYPNRGGKLLSESIFQEKIRKSIAELTKGEERTMVGYHHGSLDSNGRLRFQDMEVKELRLVDPRTLNFIILKGTKFVK